MTEAENSSSESCSTPDEAVQLHCPKSRARFLAGAIFLALVLSAVLVLGLWFVRLHMMPGATVTTSSTAVVVQLEQRMTNIEQHVQALDGRLNELSARLDKNSPVSVSTELPEPASVPSAAPLAPASAASPQETARMQSDLAGLSAAVSALQAEVKQTGSAAAQTQQTTQSSLAAAIAFIQLRETADAGRGFGTDLAALRAVTGSDSGVQQPLARLEPYAAKGAPTTNALREEFVGLEAPASVAVDKAAAQNWWERFKADLSGLISIRPLRGGMTSDAFTAVETSLASGDLEAALAAVKDLPPEAQAVFGDWQAKAEARQGVDTALRALADHFIAQASSTSAVAPANARDQP